MSLSEDRQNNRSEIRPSDNPTRLLRQKKLSRKAQAYCLLRQDPEQKTGFPDQQLRLTGSDHHGDLSQTVADRIVFQMDQAAPADQGVLRYIRERGQNTNLDSHLCLCFGGNYQETVKTGTKSLHNFTNYQRNAFRENTAFTSAYGYGGYIGKHRNQQPNKFIRLTLGQ